MKTRTISETLQTVASLLRQSQNIGIALQQTEKLIGSDSESLAVAQDSILETVDILLDSLPKNLPVGEPEKFVETSMVLRGKLDEAINKQSKWYSWFEMKYEGIIKL